MSEARSTDDPPSTPALSLATGTSTLTLHVPMTFARRGGRKRMLAPDGKSVVPAPRQAAPADTPVVRALARAFRWQKMIETGEYGTVREIAEGEGVNASYVSRVLRLALLAPGIVDEMVQGRGETHHLTVDSLLDRFPVRWDEQMRALSKCST